ncbi:MAG: hypothetical protein COB83_08015 [Gammaproteobacteria bacterium]|nr:MAG: hypothetical protein COB83_08015 [Gammaproteobacteria bacterium]
MQLTKLSIIAPLAALIVWGIYTMTNKKNRNVRNNNPLNIKKGADWVGLKAIQTDGTFAQFKAPKYGFRAAFIILLQYLEREDNTIQLIIAKWAPSSENNTGNYINYLAQKTELSPGAEILPTDLPLLMYHMANLEGAKGAFDYTQIKDGVELAEQESFVIARLNRLSAGYA